MPLGAPIGSGLGIQNAANLRILLESGVAMGALTAAVLLRVSEPAKG